jgi:adenylate cyclase
VAGDAALELVDGALQIAERSGDDFALATARMALGLTLMHRESPTDRERGLTVLTHLRDMCLNEHFTLSELPIVEAYAAWEQGRGGDLDGAIAALRKAVDDLFQAGLLSWCTMASGVFVETLLSRGSEADLQEAQTTLERLAAAPLDGGLVLREIWLLRIRALLAGARGDEFAYRDLVQQYREMATSEGWQGHIAMANAMT